MCISLGAYELNPECHRTTWESLLNSLYCSCGHISFTGDSSKVGVWYRKDSSKVGFWYRGDSSKVALWYRGDSSKMGVWYRGDSCKVRVWYRRDSSNVVDWYRKDSSKVGVWLRQISLYDKIVVFMQHKGHTIWIWGACVHVCMWV